MSKLPKFLLIRPSHVYLQSFKIQNLATLTNEQLKQKALQSKLRVIEE